MLQKKFLQLHYSKCNIFVEGSRSDVTKGLELAQLGSVTNGATPSKNSQTPKTKNLELSNVQSVMASLPKQINWSL